MLQDFSRPFYREVLKFVFQASKGQGRPKLIRAGVVRRDLEKLPGTSEVKLNEYLHLFFTLSIQKMEEYSCTRNFVPAICL